MSSISISVRVEAGQLQVIGHNKRTFIAKNVDEGRIKDNITYKDEDIKSAYQKLFSESLEKYNLSKTKTRDKIPDYFEHIRKSKQENLFYEAVVQFGGKDTNKVGTPDGEKAKKMLQKYMSDFEKRNPNLYVFNAIMHLDEETPHLHIDFIPFATYPTKGLETRVTLKGALKEMGIEGKDIKHSDRQQWALPEKAVMREIAHEFGYGVLNKGIHRKHLSVDDFKTAMIEKEKLEKKLESLLRDDGTPISRDEILLIKNQLREVLEKLQISEEKNKSPLVEVAVPDTEKSSLACEILNLKRISYTLTENGIILPQYAKKYIDKTISEFKPKKEFLSLRDKLALDIDRLIYQSQNYDELLNNLGAEGYRIRTDRKYVSVIPPNGERPIRLKGLGENYTDEMLKIRIAEKDNLFNATQIQIEKSTGLEREFLTTMSEVMILFYSRKLTPRKGRQYPNFEPTTYRNDYRISKLLDCAKTISNENITTENIEDKQKALAYDIEQLDVKIYEHRKNQKVRQKLISLSDEFFGGGEVSEKTKKLYYVYEINSMSQIEQLQQNVEKVAAEISELQGVLSEKKKLARSYDKIADMSLEITSGSYIDKLIQLEMQKEKTEELE